ncbi:PLP-dependent aminotransferase family protein [Duganella sp. BJB1802]|uniref:aminotransferase-like domain-containing protein n=1 Tax=Duganella sp. BJB1802 TaxID=2744575 RepID=UPI001594B8E5|nr:PLP-dependent aminotransferase family protein [Duganella sp. BJB1802]NVD70990.1 PLP-dependent aminotransferase family protein [Duganella sp. BJB1802]
MTLTESDLQALGKQGKASLVDQIFMLVLRQVQARDVAPGSRMPSVRELSDSCNISRDTVSRAYDKLVARGHLESRPGSGFYVKTAGKPQRPVPAATSASEKNKLIRSSWRHRILQTNKPYISQTGSGLLPDAWLGEAELSATLRALGRGNQRGLMGYGDPQGYLPLRQQLQLTLRELSIEASPSNIVLTNGATEALHLVVMSYLRTPGHFAMTEDPGPFLLSERLLASGLNLAPVPREHDGPNIEAMRAMCERHRPSILFCSSVLHNPTSSMMSAHKAFQILRLADEFDFTIVEDDTYSDLMPTTVPSQVTRMATMDQLRRVIYIGSFGKTLAAGLRVGYLVASADRIEWLLAHKIASNITTATLSERVVYRLLSQGGYRHHCAQLRNRLDELRLPLVEQLQKYGFEIDPVPQGGMFVCAHLPGQANATEVADRMLELGHLMAPGMLFSYEDRWRSSIRFNVGNSLNSPAFPALMKLLGRRG